MTPVLADLVWPALFVGQQLFAPWIVWAGVVIEFFFVRQLTSMDTRTCVFATVSMNVASALLGVLLIPLAGVVWELFPGSILYPLFGMGTFNPITWGATFVLAVLINTGLESLVLRYFFKQTIDRRLFTGILAANGISVALAFVSLFAQHSDPSSTA